MRSAISGGEGVTRSRSSSFITVVFSADRSRSRTSVRPGCAASTSRSCCTTCGVHRAAGREMTTGPLGASLMSGRLSSEAFSETDVVLDLHPALDLDHGVGGQHGRDHLVRLREEQDLDRGLQILDGDHRPDVSRAAWSFG